MSALMRAVQIEAPGQARVVAVPVPIPAAHEVRVRLEGCGVCASNLEVWGGQPWFNYPLAAGAPGHEAWGRIEALGRDVQDRHVGQRVALLGERGYAEYDVAAASAVVELPPSLDDQAFPGEPLGCALNILRRSAVQPGETVAIVGIGFLGALLTQLITRQGGRVLAVARRPFAQVLARQCGAAEVIAMDDHWRIIEQVKALTEGHGCSCVIEAVGKQWPLDLAAELTAERGRLVIAGYHQDGPRHVNMQLWNWRGLDVINAHERDPRVYWAGMAAAVDAVASGRIELESLLTHRFALDEIGTALDLARDRPDGFLKAWVQL